MRILDDLDDSTTCMRSDSRHHDCRHVIGTDQLDVLDRFTRTVFSQKYRFPGVLGFTIAIHGE